MNAAVWAWCFFDWVAGVIVGGIFAGIAQDPAGLQALNVIFNFNVLSVDTLSAAVPGGGLWSSLGILLTWNYSFLGGDFQTARLIILAITTGPIVLIILLQVVLPGIIMGLGFLGKLFPH